MSLDGGEGEKARQPILIYLRLTILVLLVEQHLALLWHITGSMIRGWHGRGEGCEGTSGGTFLCFFVFFCFALLFPLLPTLIASTGQN